MKQDLEEQIEEAIRNRRRRKALADEKKRRIESSRERVLRFYQEQLVPALEEIARKLRGHIKAYVRGLDGTSTAGPALCVGLSDLADQDVESNFELRFAADIVNERILVDESGDFGTTRGSRRLVMKRERDESGPYVLAELTQDRIQEIATRFVVRVLDADALRDQELEEFR